ncbi:MAG: hypothetical protein IJO60_06385 [Agathobacter sp.]|nr:hypothetical protein [Agathobacter sp.]
MLQSIQFNGSGPPTYVYAQKAVGSSMEFYHVFAAETRGYDGKKEKKNMDAPLKKKTVENENVEVEDFKVIDNRKMENLQQVYEKEYGRRESFLWKQR